MHFIFGILIFLYFLLRSWSRGPREHRPSNLYQQASRAFSDLAAQFGGNANAAGWKKQIYVTQDRSVELLFNADTRRLVLRLRRKMPFPFSFYRVPRLPYAFLDAFLQTNLKVEGTHYLIGSRNSQMLAALKERHGFVPLFQKLDQARFSGQTTVYGLKLWKALRDEEVNDVTLMSYIRLAQDLVHVCDPQLVAIPVQPLNSEKRCAYCKELVSDLDPPQYCQWCGTPHHRECFALNGRCSVYGCESPVSVLTPNAQASAH